MSLTVRFGLNLYALLLRLMPKQYRAAFGPESMVDLREILLEAERFQGETVVGTTLRACFDLTIRLPGEWWAALQPEPARSGRGVPYGRPGIGERLMNVFRELKLAARTLAKRPGFTGVAIITLALGIGANVAIFSIVNAVLLQPLPYADSDEIVEFRHHAPGLDLPELSNSPGMIAFYREYADYYSSIAVYGRGQSNLTGGDEAARVDIVAFEPDMLQLLQVQPLMGRPFNPDDGTEDGGNVALLAYDTWESRFGRDPSVMGRMIEVDGTPLEVVGVMPEDFAFPAQGVDVYRPLWVDPDGAFGEFGMNAVARLSPEVSVEAAQARSTELIQRMPEFFPELQQEFLDQAGFGVTVRTLRDSIVVDVESTLWIILGTVAFVLLIACANVANLFLVRAESRQKEMAVRAAMGAGRKSVAASFLSESLILGIGGGLVGVLFASGSVEWLLSIADLPRAAEVSVGPSSLGLAALLSVVAGLSFGAIPMTRYVGTRFAAVLRDGGRANTAGRQRNRARNFLVATQLALGLVLLVGSGLMLRSFAELRAVELGIEPDGVLTVGLNRNRGEDPEISAQFFADAAERVRSLPGVQTVGLTTNIPLASGNSNGGSFYIESQPRLDDELPPVALYRAIGPGYFASLGIPIVEGRDIERADWEESRRVMWINQDFANTFFDGNAIGQRIGWGLETDEDDQPVADAAWAEIVGIVGDVREFGLADEDLRPNAYAPFLSESVSSLEIQTAYLTIKAADGQDPAELTAGVREAVRDLAPGVPITATRTMDEIVSEAMESTSVTMIVLAVATAMALFLGAIGLAGVISYVVGQRTREIGVRVALGAQTGDVSRMILRQSMLVTAGGTLLGLFGAFALTRLMEALLFEVSTTDPVTFITAPVVLVAVSFLATWFPVRRAARVDPMEALRSE
jgi:predicted permease